MDYSKVESQLGDWGPKLKPFVESKDFDEIFAFLKAESREGKTICPEAPNVFRAFKECPYSDLKCVFILQDPYPWVKFDREAGKWIYTADGMAMSCSNTGICQPSLNMFYDGMEDDLGETVIREPNLAYLANQGVLLLNTSLTVEKDKPTSHQGKWDKFIKFLLGDVINSYFSGAIYVSFGEGAHVAAKCIVPFLHWDFEVEHPAFAARKERPWKHQNIFRNINKILKDNNNEKILWSYATYRAEQQRSTL